MSFTNLALIAATRVEDLTLAYRAPVEEEAGVSVVWWIMVPFVALAVGLIVHRTCRKRRHTVETPNDLLRELCYAHRINGTGRNLLGVVAEKAALEVPASMFLAMKKYDAAVDAASKHVKFDRHDQAMLRMLRRQLFTLSR
tara:strand:+ start:93656 stop:94078 length:423 start_codon:yes stop_codon:yes gene_type:complete